MSDRLQYLKGVVLDWAGTTVDHGSCAPAIVFQEVFRSRGVPITPAQAREPMGKAKRDHIATIAAMPEIADAWQRQHGTPCGEADIDAMYAEFLPLQKEVLRDHGRLIDGTTDFVDWLRAEGLKIGSSTGYTRELMEVVRPVAAQQGYQPDCTLCVEDATEGRPAPYLIFEAAMRMGVYPLWHMVKVDDTPVGIEAGRNAGCWTIGITRTGNGVGLSQREYETLPPAEQATRVAAAAAKLNAAGAHATAESIAELKPLFFEFDQRLGRGERP
ncbi:MAG: phosphonoacetaldehyde hydrolase [Planctomycetota bacterium]